MDTMTEEIALVPGIIQHQDGDEVLNKRKLHRKFNSKKDLKEFILWILLFICLLLIAGPLALHISYAVPTVKTRNIAKHIFSEERAFDYLINLTQYGSRVSNTRGSFDARDYLVSQIKRISLTNERHLQFEIDLQNFTDFNHNQLQNILVRVSNPITKSEDIPSLMLSAHYDTVEFSPGGSDDGSGVVILLQLLSNLVNDLTVTFADVHLLVLFTNAEEPGSEGATAFMTNHTWSSNIHRFINIDSSSCNEVGSLIQLKPSQLVIDYSRVLRPRANVILGKIQKWAGITTDYRIFNFIGFLPGYDFGSYLNGYTYHTPLDQPSIIKQGVIQDLGDNLGILIRNILLGHVQEIEDIMDTDPLIYFDILNRYLIIYKTTKSIIIQRILIILIIIIGIILMILDHIWHRQRSLTCNNSRCIYCHFTYPFIVRAITIIVYFISNIISVIIGLLFSLGFAWIMSKIRPVSWFGNPTLAVFLFSFPCLIGFITIGYLFDLCHRLILRKLPKNSSESNSKNLNDVSFDFEQNLSILLTFSLLMIVTIYYDSQLFYIILVWSIFICPTYLLLMIIEFILHWKQIKWGLFERRYHWLYFPLIICLLPLTHTIEIMNRLIRILIPLLARRVLYGWSLRTNIIICSIIAVSTVFFVLIFIPILQRIKQFGRILIVLSIAFFIIFIFACIRQPYTKNHPNVFYANHISTSIFTVEKLPNASLMVPLTSQTSTITILTYDDLALPPILDQFSVQSGHLLHNKRCFRSTICTFDDTFNRTSAVKYIKIESMKNFINYTITVQHVLSYNIQISSISPIKFIVRNELNVPRVETIIDVTLNSSKLSFNIDIKIRRCEINDSPFLLLFTRLIPNIVLMGDAYCHAIDDDVTLKFALNTLSNQNK